MPYVMAILLPTLVQDAPSTSVTQVGERAAEGNTVHCTPGSYRTRDTIWDCRGAQGNASFELAPKTSVEALVVPQGVRDFIYTAEAAKPLAVKVRDAHSHKTLLEGQDSSFKKSWGAATLKFVAGLEGDQHTASIEIEGLGPSTIAIMLSSRSEAASLSTKMGYAYSAISPCPKLLDGCQPYDEMLAMEAVKGWSCVALRQFGGEAQVWQAVAASQASPSASGSSVPWYRFADVWRQPWTRNRTTWAAVAHSDEGEEWQFAFKFFDQDGDMELSEEEFARGLGTCEVQPQAKESHDEQPALRAKADPHTETWGFVGLALLLSVGVGIGLWFWKKNLQSKLAGNTSSAAISHDASTNSVMAAQIQRPPDRRPTPTLRFLGSRSFREEAPPGMPSHIDSVPDLPSDMDKDPKTLRYLADGEADSLLNAMIASQALNELSDMAMQPGGKEKLTQQKSATAILEAMTLHPGHLGVQTAACETLRHLVSQNEANQLQLAENGGPELVLQALREHGDSVKLTEEALWVLWQLGNTAQGRTRIIAEEGATDIEQAMQEHPESAAVQEIACLALGNLAFEEEVRRYVLESGSLNDIVGCMEQHASDVGVQEAAIFALHNLACTPELAAEISDLGVKDLIRSAMHTHQKLTDCEEAHALLELMD